MPCMTEWQVKVLGVGKGASQVYHGETSTSLVLERDGIPLLWIDTGLGSTRACLATTSALPAHILITHNHSDHAGELPVILAVEHKHGKRPTVIAEAGVARRLRNARLAEHHDWLAPEELASWQDVPLQGDTTLDGLDGLTVEFRPGKHVERCAGFLLRWHGVPLLAYSGDSGFFPELYEFLMAAPCVFLDMRPHGNANHAALADFDPAWRHRAHIVGHGIDEAGRNDWPDLPLCHAGQCIPIERN